jgi:hypothetical protein
MWPYEPQGSPLDTVSRFSQPDTRKVAATSRVDGGGRAASIDAIEAAENGTPRSLRCPRAASSAEMSRSDLWPPLRPPPTQLTDKGDKLRVRLCVALAAFDLLATQCAFAIPSALELRRASAGRRRSFRCGRDVGEQLLRGEDVLGEPCLQRLQAPDGAANPVGERRTILIGAHLIALSFVLSCKRLKTLNNFNHIVTTARKSGRANAPRMVAL